MYSCRNCGWHIKFGDHLCPHCRWFNFQAGREEQAIAEFKRKLIVIAIKIAKREKAYPQSITVLRACNITYRIIALDNDTQIITQITQNRGELWKNKN
jgi:hypothetical protein